MNSHIQFSKTNIKLSDYDLEQIKSIIEGGWVVSGRYVKCLEEIIKKKFNVRYVLGCSNCTLGLMIALKAAKIKRKKIALPQFTWPSTLYAIECSGNIPVFCDINKDTWLIDDISKYGVDVIMPVDTFGNEINIDSSLPIIIDAAHGYGLSNLGNRGLVEVVSFSFTKAVTAMQGGVILTNNEDIYEEAKELVRLSAKMLEISALVCIKSIYEYDKNLEIKRQIIKRYRENIKIPFDEQKVETETNHSVYAILLESKEIRDKIAESFRNNNVEVKIYYEPLLPNNLSMLKNTSYVYDRIIALPCYSGILESDIKRISNFINKV